MELFLKTAEGKTPFIGVVFEEQVVAATLNSNWPNYYPEDIYTVSLDPGARLRLIFKSKTNPGTLYELKYDPIELLKFMAKTKDCKFFKFGHIFRRNTAINLVRTMNDKPWILKVDSVKILVEY